MGRGGGVDEPKEGEKELSTVLLGVSLPSQEEEKVSILHSTPLGIFVYICTCLYTTP